MRTLKQIGISVLVTLIILAGVSFMSGSDGLGATITDVLSTDTVKNALLTKINTNITNLNNDKIESDVTVLNSLTSAISLVTVGTIGTGVWQGTDITVANGGTGLSTLTANAVMLGNGTSNIAFVSGLGTSGQFLTSQGAGADPQWTTSSIDLNANYSWTGYHIFSSFNATIASTTNATSTNQTVTGNAIFSGEVSGANSEVAFTTTTDIDTFNSTASTTVFTFTIPANKLGTSNAVKLKLNFSVFKVGGSGDIIFFELNYGGSKQNLFLVNLGTDATTRGTVEILLIANNSTSVQETTIYIDSQQPGVRKNDVTTDYSIRVLESATHSVDSTSDQTFSLIIRNSVSEVGTGVTIDNIIGEYIR